MPRSLIRDGKIAAVGTGSIAVPHARRIDGRGCFLIPGLIDSHVHVGASAAIDDEAIAAHAAEVGKRADMLLLKEDPLGSVTAYDSIETVILGGQAILRDSLRGLK